MAKISKRELNKHNAAVALLERGNLDFNEREQVYADYHEGAGKMNNLISAHFTPTPIARSMAQNVRNHNWVDIGAGIGKLSYVMMRENSYHFKDGFIGICVEQCVEYYEIGKKLLPECVWINGSIFDQEVIDEIKMIMSGMELKFSIISNPPYGNQVKGSSDQMKYSGATFEYKAMEMGAILGAYDGCFLIPQISAPFRMTGDCSKGVYNEIYKTREYKRFLKETELGITANIGYSTEILDEDEQGWKDVKIVTEIAIVEYEELDYKPKFSKNGVNLQELSPAENQLRNAMMVEENQICTGADLVQAHQTSLF